MNMDADLDAILSDWTTCTTSNDQTDVQYRHVWQSVPAIVLELKALRIERREEAATWLARDARVRRGGRCT